MFNYIMHSVSTFPEFLLFFVVAVAMLAGFTKFYVWFTPNDELQMVRDGNTAAAVELFGAMVGFALPLALVIAHSANVYEMVIWGIVSGAVQMGGFVLVDRVFHKLGDAIKNGQMAAAVFVAGASVALGILNAACIVP